MRPRPVGGVFTTMTTPIRQTTPPMAGAARVLVHARRGGAGGVVKLGQSVTGVFCHPHEDAVLVHHGLTQGHLLLSDVTFPGATLTLLQRPPFCPAKHLEALQVTVPEHLRGHGVVAAVAVLLEATTGHVLLTRRASTLSTFPSVWVPPGGHLEPGEELLDVGLRELKEETGLHLPPGTFSWRTLGLWESIYPPMLSRGPPLRHHVVTYLLLQSSEPHQQVEGRMCPNQQEVSAYTWLEPQVLEAIAATQDGAERWEKVPSTLPPTVGITELSGGSSCPTRVPTSTFLSTVPAHGEDVERVSTGTKFALGRWMETRGGPQGHGVGGGTPQFKENPTQPGVSGIQKFRTP